MDKLIKFFDVVVPTTVCNLKCDYCYISHRPQMEKKIKSIEHSPSEVRTALSKKRLGGSCIRRYRYRRCSACFSAE